MSSSLNKAKQLQDLKMGKGIEHILDEAYKILGNPILAHDMEYKLIAHNEAINDDPLWNEIITNGFFSYDTLIFFKDECFLEMAANANKITFLLSEKLPYDRLFGKLFTKPNLQVGSVCMTAANKPFEEDDPELFEILVDILNKELYRNEYFQSYGQTYMETLTSQLIEGRIMNKDLYTAHIESVYIGTKRNLYLAVADISQCDPTYTQLTYFRNMFKQHQPAFKYALYSNYVVMIISSDHAVLNVRNDLNKLIRVFKQYNIYVGISGCFENLFDLPRYYAQAVNVLNDGLRRGNTERIFQ